MPACFLRLSRGQYLQEGAKCLTVNSNPRYRSAGCTPRRDRAKSSFEPVVQTTAWPHQISGQVLSSHSIVSSSRTVRPCSPWGGRWIGHWRTTWSTVCLSAPHSQAAEEAIPHLYKQERKRPAPVRRRLSRTQALLGMIIPGGVPVSGMNKFLLLP